jgi:protein-tyrosine phosphatase
LIWITEQIAVSGTTISPGDWLELHETEGVTAILNLRSESQDDFTSPPPVAYLWLPVEDFTTPAMEQMLIGSEFIDTAVKCGERVLIHCRLGIGRSPTMAAAYLVWTGMSVDAAIRQVEAPDKGYHPVIDRDALIEFNGFAKRWSAT